MEQERHLARDEDGWYKFFEGNPKKEKGTWYENNKTPHSEMIDEVQFHAIFGCHPVRKGRKKRIKRILIELED